MKPANVLNVVCVAVVLGSGTVLSGNARANDIPGYPDNVESYDSREVALLPRYCKFTPSFKNARVPGSENQAEFDRWVTTMGQIFWAMHHYCLGLMKTNRAVLLAKDQRIRTFYLGNSIFEFDYVLDRAPPDFVLIPEIRTKKGENLLRLGRTGPGIRELELAIEVKPDYWPPYAVLSDFYAKNGNLAKAREMLDKGLANSPDAAALKRRLSELGGGKKTKTN